MTKQAIQNGFLKNLMIGLLYPAVLGNIIYIIMTVVHQRSLYDSGTNFNLKFNVLIITTFFYLFDYLYIYFTKDFKWWMFLCDVAFVFILFFTYQNIHLPTIPQDANPSIEISNILICYLLFVALYFIWDCIEKKKSTDAEEKKMYKWILVWEYCSAFLLIVNLIIHNIQNFLVGYIDTISILSLTFITLTFGLIDFFKFKFWVKHELTKY